MIENISKNTLYDNYFYEVNKNTQGGSSLSLINTIKDFFDKYEIELNSVIDVGCGSGAILSGWMSEYGVEDVLGIDGDYVEESLLIPTEKWTAHDLRLPFNTSKKYDLVECFEVAEHLEVEYADHIVEMLCGLGDIIAFSAAIPLQGGTHHVNEQFQGYWANKFNSNGYIPIDYIRPRLQDDLSVSWWYRQNTIIYIKKEKWNSLVGEVSSSEQTFVMDVICKELYFKNISEAKQYNPIIHIETAQFSKKQLFKIRAKCNGRRIAFFGAGINALIIDYHCTMNNIFPDRIFLDSYKHDSSSRLPISSFESIKGRHIENYIVVTLSRSNREIEMKIKDLGYSNDDWCYFIDDTQ